MADRVASVFTPFVLLLATLTLLTWLGLCLGVPFLGAPARVPQEWYDTETGGDPYLFSLLFAISVVVISCPCALGLATPTAIMVGTSVGTQHGVLIKVSLGLRLGLGLGLSLGLSLSLRFKGLYVYTVDFLFHVEWCIRQAALVIFNHAL